MGNTAVDYTNESRGAVLLEVDREAIKAWWIAQGLPPEMAEEEGKLFIPSLFYDYAGALGLTIQERVFIPAVWSAWSEQSPQHPCFRVWGRQPSLDALSQSLHRSTKTIKKYADALQQKGMLIVSGDIYDFTPLLEALIAKAPLSRDRIEMERMLQKVWGKRQ